MSEVQTVEFPLEAILAFTTGCYFGDMLEMHHLAGFVSSGNPDEYAGDVGTRMMKKECERVILEQHPQLEAVQFSDRPEQADAWLEEQKLEFGDSLPISL